MIILLHLSPNRFTPERQPQAQEAVRLFARNSVDEQDYCLSAHKCRLDGDEEGFKEYSLRAEFALWAAERQLARLFELAGEAAPT